ncbi:MAG: hypothetical protein H6726_06405 [Sandaracinaceae bacterium]|nr:hypothetical protein [Myxococcales bacterium]MCB9657268.1 hypothetical protein [Sandaracinaceae bacterium]
MSSVAVSSGSAPTESPTAGAPVSRGLLILRGILFGSVALAFPVSAGLVFGLGVDRHAAADGLSVVYGVGLVSAVFASFFPLPSLRTWTRAQRVESLVLAFLGMSYVTHLSWELGWLVLRDAIAASPDAPWAYVWWAYIDGGDARYAVGDPLLIAMETLSVCNGLVGATALVRYLRSGRTATRARLVMGGTAVVHLYSASLYYASELLTGLPNVGDGFIAVYIKFGLANALWVVAPFFVFAWCLNGVAPRPEDPGATLP